MKVIMKPVEVNFTLYFIIKIKAKDKFIKESSCYCFLLALVLSSQLTETSLYLSSVSIKYKP